MSGTSITESIQAKPTREIVDDVMQQAERALESGARATAEVNELKRRADETLDWRKQFDRHPGIAMALVAGLSILLYLAFSRRR